MILTLLLIFSLLFDGSYHLLEWKCKQLIAKGGNHSQWVKLSNLKDQLSPWKGFMLFLDPLLIMAIAQDWMGASYPWPVWAIGALIGIVCSYNTLLSYIPRFYRARFVKSTNPDHNAKWLLSCARNSLGHAIQSDYPRTHSFFRLAGRLVICNTIGHHWTRWEAVKYGDFGNSRKCKICLVNETNQAGESRYCETHTRTWRKIVNPNSVFRRVYIKPDN